jgi:hypothetical protein
MAKNGKNRKVSENNLDLTILSVEDCKAVIRAKGTTRVCAQSVILFELYSGWILGMPCSCILFLAGSLVLNILFNNRRLSSIQDFGGTDVAQKIALSSRKE